MSTNFLLILATARTFAVVETLSLGILLHSCHVQSVRKCCNVMVSQCLGVAVLFYCSEDDRGPGLSGIYIRKERFIGLISKGIGVYLSP